MNILDRFFVSLVAGAFIGSILGFIPALAVGGEVAHVILGTFFDLSFIVVFDIIGNNKENSYY